MKLNSSSLPIVAFLLLSSNLFGATPAPVVTMDEYGNGDVNGTALASHLGTDPNPAHVPGQTGVLIYGSLPFAGTAGDLKVFVGQTPGVVIRFNGDNTVIFYAAANVGVNGMSPATQFTPPIPPFPVQNTATANFTGSVLTYKPAAGQPGYDASGPIYVLLFSSPLAAANQPTNILNPDGSNLEDAYQINYSSHLDIADNVINIMNAGSSAASIAPVAGSNTPGSICVNAYVYESDEKLLACCSCNTSSNGANFWPVIYGSSALLANAAARPSSVVIKLLATSPGSTATPCDPSFKNAPFSLVPGMTASSTHAHPTNAAPNSFTETLFLNRPLSMGEATKLQTDCSALGTAGLCPGCQAGSFVQPALGQ